MRFDFFVELKHQSSTVIYRLALNILCMTTLWGQLLCVTRNAALWVIKC